MIQEKKKLLLKYLTCIAVASVIAVAVFSIDGFFTDEMAVNIQILADGFSVAGILMTLFAGMIFISSEGALLGIGFVMRNVFLTFIPMGRAKHETYAQYRERKITKLKKQGDHCVLFTGLFFLFIGIVFSLIWFFNFYQMPV